MQNSQDYEIARAKCWEEFKKRIPDGEVQWQLVFIYDAFCYAFDHAYTLGKQEAMIEAKSDIKRDLDFKKNSQRLTIATQILPALLADKAKRSMSHIDLANVAVSMADALIIACGLYLEDYKFKMAGINLSPQSLEEWKRMER